MRTRLRPLRALMSIFVVLVVVAGVPAMAAAAPLSGAVAAPFADDEPFPDRDGDGVADDVDGCPDSPGEATYNGCLVPDTDNDGVYDDVDTCPSEPGPAENNGCPVPDNDGDGLTNDVDACPDQAGPYDGCPLTDLDGDGVTDDIDACPNTAGTSWDGCPEDTDGDGVTEDVDGCPGTPQGENVDIWGCSLTQLDSDNDGVDDEHDMCPGTVSDTDVDVVGCALLVDVTANAVAFKDRCGHGKDRFVVPATTGVVYSRGSAVTSAGTHRAIGIVKIVAAAEDGYSLVGETSWRKSFSDHRCRPGRVSVTSPRHDVVRVVNRERQTLSLVVRGHARRVKAGAAKTFRTSRNSVTWRVRWDDYYGKRTGSIRVK